MAAKNSFNAGQPEGRLRDYIIRLDRFRERRTVVHIHISRLSPQHRREHNLRIATHTFDNIIGQHEGEIFLLSNNDIVFIAEGVPQLQIERSIERLRALFSEDPLIYSETSTGEAFCSWYNLESEYDRVLQLAKTLLKQVMIQAQQVPVNDGLTQLDAKSLAGLEDILIKADITNFVRNQTICLHARNTLTPIFDEMYVSIDDLQKTLLPNNNLRGNKWLFQYVTEVLDKRMFAYLMRQENIPGRVFSINLNISTILSPEFQSYDKALTASARGGNLVIEVQKHDIFADMGAYIFAQQYLHERTHKLCLDGITHLTLQFIDREQLNLDLIKLCWSTELLEKKDRLLTGLREHIDRIGPQRFIMIHCDTPDALDIGHELGISMFQGRYVSHVLQGSKNAMGTPTYKSAY